MPPDENTEE
jgi:hypothetical protein